ncbi:MAG: carboxypeptidase-like regulatory domain-containing protein [Gemmatimonadaceae bacterium]
MVTSAPRGGLSGVIGDTTYAMVDGAEVRIMGEGKWVLSDSTGAFHIPIEKGTYAVVVSKKGYGKSLVSVTVPPDSGRKIAVWLGSLPRNPNRTALAMDGIRIRIMTTPAHRYKMITAEDLAKTDMNVVQMVRVAGRSAVLDDCPATIGGDGFSLPLYLIDKNEIALLEVIGAPLARRAPKCPGVIVWMKP